MSKPATQESFPPNALGGLTIVAWNADQNAVAAARSLEELGASVIVRPVNQKAEETEPNAVGIVTRGKLNGRVCTSDEHYLKAAGLGVTHTVRVREHAFLYQEGTELRRAQLVRCIREATSNPT